MIPLNPHFDFINDVNYNPDLIDRDWKYLNDKFRYIEDLFKHPKGLYGRPPVFLPSES